MDCRWHCLCGELDNSNQWELKSLISELRDRKKNRDLSMEQQLEMCYVCFGHLRILLGVVGRDGESVGG